MFPVINIGPLVVQAPGLILLAGLWIGLSLAERYAPRQGVKAERLYNLVFLALISGVLGGRLFFALQNPAAFAASPISLVSLNPGLFDLSGAAAAALIASLIYAQRTGMAFWPTLDALTPFLAVMGGALGFANLASGNGFGAPTSLPWAIELWGARRHPSQVYEILAAAAIAAAVWPRGKTPARFWFVEKAGARFLIFIAFSAGARLFLEAFRGDSSIILNGVRTAQIGAWLVLALALYGLTRLRAEPRANIESGAGTADERA